MTTRDAARKVAVKIWVVLQVSALITIPSNPAWRTNPVLLAAGVFAPAFLYLLVRLVTSTGYTLTVSDEGLSIPLQGDAGTMRLIPWRLVSGVEWTEDPESAGWGWLSFRFKSVRWGWQTTVSAEEGARVIREIRAMMPASAAADSDLVSAADYFELYFDLVLPPGLTIVHTEYHPESVTGRWSLRVPDDVLKNLLTTKGAISAWYPATSDQRFRIGDLTYVGGTDLRGVYAISLASWNSTPALVWDAETKTLHGLLVSAMG